MDNLKKAFEGKKVFLTGHTGFKGAWMLQMLDLLGAQVKGYALEPASEKDLFVQLDAGQFCYASVMGDVLDEHLLKGELLRFEPDYVIHMAAQSLVRKAYDEPVGTFSVNVMGTINVLDALRGLDKPCTVILVTTDKVYENTESGQPFLESDKLGGYDPYSASKAASELAITSYRRSFFPLSRLEEHGKRLISVRSGNVIGGGDYSENRIIPDIIRSVEREAVVQLRNPSAIRPWQHVLEPLTAYLRIAASAAGGREMESAYNIGPDPEDVLDVETVTRKFMAYYGQGRYVVDRDGNHPYEAKTLLLDNRLLKEHLNWTPRLSAEDSIRWTAEWYADKQSPARDKTAAQIRHYLGL